MNLEDVYYFSVKKRQNPDLFKFCEETVRLSQRNVSDKNEVDRRLALLTKSQDAEHLRQSSNFLAELKAYRDLYEQSREPHWVPESKEHRSPDIKVDNSRQYPVEVKHLNSPRDEHEALYHEGTYGGSVNRDYDIYLEKKVEDFICDSCLKFGDFNEVFNNFRNQSGIIYLFFSKSNEAMILDGLEGEEDMETRIRSIVDGVSADSVEVIIKDIDSSVVDPE